ncbi:iron-sulfur cluster-binding domain-containing protein [Sphingobacterium sp. SYP-B4668]|uniref:iron-sulfur cluster-binding domain-containing protein n=1 Tax=Sphingobacterium sp. SYP-B4668 TaxID=2996035 RepID=UPI0022DD3597|nr:iron-sulfur cluster-binding domain-containing protein [Sphingobacterium sp. SYP-B4668]
MRRYKWRTHEIIMETADTLTIVFDTGEERFGYESGQYLNIRCTIGGEPVSRSYSFSSAPTERYPRITVKRVLNGRMSNYLVDYASDISEWNVEGPFGNFVLHRDMSAETEVVLLAGGSGMSPLLSMLKSIGNDAPAPLLLYACKTPADVLFKSELDELEQDKRVHTYYAFSLDIQKRSGGNCMTGRFSQPVIQSVIEQHIHRPESAHYYICGPTALMQLYQEALQLMDIPVSQIHSEYFDPVATVDVIPGDRDGAKKEVLVSYYEMQYQDAEQQTYECTLLIEVQGGQSLLDAMRAYDIVVSSSCHKGTCGACWAMTSNGKVKMTNNYALTEDEVAEGKILLCQSFPVDDAVSIILA